MRDAVGRDYKVDLVIHIFRTSSCRVKVSMVSCQSLCSQRSLVHILRSDSSRFWRESALFNVSTVLDNAVITESRWVVMTIRSWKGTLREYRCNCSKQCDILTSLDRTVSKSSVLGARRVSMARTVSMVRLKTVDTIDTAPSTSAIVAEVAGAYVTLAMVQCFLLVSMYFEAI
jgi:hypothetical protein